MDENVAEPIGAAQIDDREVGLVNGLTLLHEQNRLHDSAGLGVGKRPIDLIKRVGLNQALNRKTAITLELEQFG